MPTELFTSKATYPNNIVIPPVALRHPVIGMVPEGNRRDHNIVRVSSFASKELSWHERRCIVLVVLVGCSLNRNSSLPFFLRAIDPLLSSMISTKNSSLRIVVIRIGILQSL